MHVAAATEPPVSISTVHGAFYPNPNDSGSLDLSNLSTPAFTQNFPVIDFNPPVAAQVNCSNSTGVDENTRPFTEVVPNADGTCSTSVAQGNGQQAGGGGLFTFQGIFTANLEVASAGQVTFNFFSDDGWMLGIGPVQGGTGQPTYVSGSMINPLSSTPGQNLPVVGSFNTPSSPAQNQVTVNFPAGGTYPLEVDYTECCGGQLALVLGTTFGNPIPPSASCNSAAASTALADVFGADVCQIAEDEASVAAQVVTILNAMSSLPPVQPAGTNVWLQPAAGTWSTAKAVAAETALEGLRTAVQHISDKLAEMVAEKIAERILGGEIPCAVSAMKGLLDAAQGDAQAASDAAEAAQNAANVLRGAIDATEARDLVDATDEAATAYLDKFGNLADALSKAAAGCFLTQGQYEALAQQLQAASTIIVIIREDVLVADLGMSFIASTGWLLLGQGGIPAGLPIVVDPPAFGSSGSLPALGIFPAASAGQLFGPQALLPLALSTSNTTAGNFLTATGNGFNPSTTIGLYMHSIPRRLATLTTDSVGSFKASLQIPSATPAGSHELYAVGAAPDGSLRVLGAKITVKAASSAYILPPCIGTLTGTINGSLTVLPGMVCKITGGQVNGSVTVEAGAIFEADSTVIGGGVVASSPTAIVLCGDTINGSVSVQSSAFPAVIGTSASKLCALTKVSGSVHVS